MKQIIVLVLVLGLFTLGCTQGGTQQENKAIVNETQSQPKSLPPTAIASETCPSSCDDGNSCTKDTCEGSTSHKCVHEIMKDGASCGTDNSCMAGVCSATKIQKPTYIETFKCVDEGVDRLRCYLIFDTKKGYDANLSYELVDSDGQDLYYSTAQITNADFVLYANTLTGKELGEAYEWNILKSSIKKSFGNENVFLLIRLPDSTILNSSDNAQYQKNIPRYSDDEINQIYENEYLNNSVLLNNQLDIGDQITFRVVRYGYYKAKPYSFSASEKYLRVDIEVINNDNEKHYFYDSSMALIDNLNNQYDTEYSSMKGSFDGGDIFPGVSKKGFILFKDIDPTATNAKLTFEYGYDSHYNPILHELNFDISKLQRD